MISKTIFLLLPLIASINGEANIATTTREPSIQAYGLPKRFFTDNGNIQLIHLGNLPEESTTPEARPKFLPRPGNPPIFRRQFVPNEGTEDGIIEIVHFDSNGSHEGPKILTPRNRRAIDIQSSSSDIKEDMQTEESKVFRPLFVYRQQLAKRQRTQRERNDQRYYFEKNYFNNKNSLQYYPRSG